MKQAKKKDIRRHSKAFSKELGHWEGKFWCNCEIRGFRHHLAMILHGSDDIDQEVLEYYHPTEEIDDY